MNKEREIAGIKVFVSNETYNEYKGTLQDQINELQNRIDFLIDRNDEKQNIINKAIEYINTHSEMTDIQIYGIENVLAFRGSLEKLLNILQGKEE